MAYQFPNDPKFLKLASKLSTEVMYATQVLKVRVGRNPLRRCRCPMGCLNLNGPYNPSYMEAALAWGSTWTEARAFITGFDYGRTSETPRSDPYFELGVAYRKRFEHV
jgi:hypothetical protein